MEYRMDLFEGVKKKVPEYPQYDCISSAFFDVFFPLEAEPGKEYPILLEGQAEAYFERLKIYREKILKEKSYPVFGFLGIYPAKPTSMECFQQFTGFPVFKVFGKLGRPLPKEVDEIFLEQMRILVKPDYMHFCPKDSTSADYFKPELLQSDEPCLYRLINDLAGKGILFPNIEKILSDETDSFPDYPVFLDKDVAPEEFTKPIDPVELYIAFRIPNTDLEPKEFEAYCSLIRSMSPEESFRFAFQNETSSENPVQVARMALRDYFCALMKPLVNDFFYREYGIEKIFPTTVMDHDSRFYPLAMRYFYFGSNFVMAAKVTLDMSLCDTGVGMEENLSDGEVIGKYCLSTKDRKAVALAFETVKAHFKATGEKIYPALFLRQMGLPFPAYEKVAYFDFEEGDGESFAALLDYQDFDYFSMAFPNVTLGDYGEILFSDTEEFSSLHYCMARHGIFVLFENIVPYQINYTVGLDEEGKECFPSMADNAELVKEAMRHVDSTIPGIKEALSSDDTFLTCDYKGNYPQVQKFFQRLQKGEYSMDILRSLLGKDSAILSTLSAFLYDVMGHFFLKKNKEFKAEFDNRCKIHPLAACERMPIVFGDGKEKGVLGLYGPYRRLENGKLVSYEDEDSLLFLFAQLLYQAHFRKKGGFFAAVSFFHEEQNRWIYSPYAEAMFVTGLDEESLKNFPVDFKHSISNQVALGVELSQENKIEYWNARRSSPALISCLIRRELMMDKTYVTGEGKDPAPVIAQPGLSLYGGAFISPDILFSELSRTQFPFQYDKKKMTLTDFLAVQLDAILGNVVYDKFPWESEEYVANANDATLRSAYYRYCFDDLAEPSEFTKALSIYTLDDVIRAKTDPKIRPLPTAQDPFFLEYGEGRGEHGVSAGRFFYAYCSIPQVLPFRYLKEDQKDVLFLEKVIQKIPLKGVQGAMDAILRDFFRNPPMAIQSIKNKIRIKRDQKRFEDFPKTEITCGCTEGLMNLTPICRDPFRSTYLRRKALSEGYVLFSDKNILSTELRDAKNLSTDLNASYDEMQSTLIYLDERDDKSLNAQIFHPNRRLFETILEDFIHDFSKTSLSSDFLFYAREAMDYLYGKDRTFFAKAVNAIHFDGNFKKKVKKALQGFSIPELDTLLPMDFVYDFIALFVLRLQQEYLTRLWAREVI